MANQVVESTVRCQMYQGHFLRLSPCRKMRELRFKSSLLLIMCFCISDIPSDNAASGCESESESCEIEHVAERSDTSETHCLNKTNNGISSSSFYGKPACSIEPPSHTAECIKPDKESEKSSRLPRKKKRRQLLTARRKKQRVRKNRGYPTCKSVDGIYGSFGGLSDLTFSLAACHSPSSPHQVPDQKTSHYQEDEPYHVIRVTDAWTDATCVEQDTSQTNSDDSFKNDSFKVSLTSYEADKLIPQATQANLVW